MIPPGMSKPVDFNCLRESFASNGEDLRKAHPPGSPVAAGYSHSAMERAGTEWGMMSGRGRIQQQLLFDLQQAPLDDSHSFRQTRVHIGQFRFRGPHPDVAGLLVNKERF